MKRKRFLSVGFVASFFRTGKHLAHGFCLRKIILLKSKSGGIVGSSFKMQKGGKAKDQAVQVGVLMLIIGIVVYFLVHDLIGIGLTVLGLIVAIGGRFASE